VQPKYLLREDIPQADVQDSMLALRNAGRQALAAFFHSLAPQHGHWYSILLSSTTTVFDEQHNATFLPLSKLVSIEEGMLQAVLVHCGLAMFRKGVGHSALLKAWDYFIHERELSSHFTIKKKKRIYIRLGSYNKSNHPQQTPSDIWAASMSGILQVPMVHTASMSTKLAVEVGTLGLIYPAAQDSVKASDSNSESDSEKNSDSNSEEEEQENDDVSHSISIDLPSASEFPLLHALFSTQVGENLFDCLLN
jgi:hypothetical protein